MAAHRQHFVTEHVGVDLLPQRRGRSAVGDHHPGERDADLAEDVDMVAEPERDRFQHSPIQIGAGVSEVHAGEDTPQVRIVDGALLAQEVRQAQHLGGTAGRRLLVERGQGGSADEGLEPPDQAPAGGHAAVGQPVARHRMRVQVEPLVDHAVVGGDQDVAGPTEFDQGVARIVDSGGERRQDVVGAADHQSGARAKAGGFGCPGAQLTDLRARPHHWGQRHCVESRRGQDRVGGFPVDGEQPRLQRPVLFDVQRRAQRREHPVVGTDPACGAGVDLRFVLAQPHCRRGHRLLGQRRAGEADQVHLGKRATEVGHLTVCSGVVLQDCPPQRLRVRVDRYDGGHHSRGGQRTHLLGGHSGGREHFADGFDRVRVPLTGVGLGDPRTGRVQIGGSGRGRDDAAEGVQQHGLGAGGPDVDADGVARHRASASEPARGGVR